MKTLPLMIVAMLGWMISLAPCTAEAQGFGNFGGYGAGGFYGSYYGFPSIWQNSYNGRVPPYFALHPPVYYSGQITRIPYGASPFANSANYSPATGACCAPRGGMPSVSQEVPPQIILNPYYKAPQGKSTSITPPSALPASETTKTTLAESLGQMIQNPHYQPTSRVAQR